MKCEDVRLQLAAYRRSDWSVEEQRLVRHHLDECAECRKWETESRRVGERLRELPTITPPADFRARVFAAIQADQIEQSLQSSLEVPIQQSAQQEIPVPLSLRTYASAAAQGAVIDPEIRNRVTETANSKNRPQRVWFGRATAIGTIAALLAMMFTIRFAPLMTTVTPPSGPTSFCLIADRCTSHPYQVTAPSQFPTVTSTIANGNIILFSAQSNQGQNMVYLRNREAPPSIPILSEPTTSTITFENLNSNMVVWLEVKPDKTWSLNATPLTNQPLKSLTDGMFTIVSQRQQLHGLRVSTVQSIWISGQQGIFTFTSTDGAMRLEYFDTSTAFLSYTFVAQALPWHSIVDPYLDGQTIYWVDKSIGPGDAIQGVIWRQLPNQAATPLNLNGSVFGPIAAGSQIAWFQSNGTPSLTSTVGGTLATQGGVVMARDADASQPNQISQGIVDAATLQRGTGYMIWRIGTGSYIYHIGGTGSNVYDHLLPAASIPLTLTNQSIAWIDHSTGGLTSSPDTIYVIDVP